MMKRNLIDRVLWAVAVVFALAATRSLSHAAIWTGTNGGSGSWATFGTTAPTPGWNTGSAPNAVGDVAQFIDPISIANATTVQDTGAAVTVGALQYGNGNDMGDFSWTITNTNGLTLDQDGLVLGNATISNSSTNTGANNALIVNAGTLSLADTLSVVNSSSSTANNGAIQIGSVIAGTGAITLRSEQAIDPNMSLSQARGAIRLTAANTYVGTTAIEKGLVVFTNTTATTSTVFGTNAANIITLGNAAAPTDNAALGFQTSGASGANVIMSQPIVVAAGSGTRTIAVLPNTAAATYTITYSGAITLNSDVMLYNPDTVTGAVNGGTVAVGNFTGTISGTGGIKKTGDGIIFLNAPGGTTSSYSGDTVVDAGFLVTGNTVPNGAGRGNVIVNSGGTYSISNNETINGLSGSGAIRPYGGTVRTLTIGDNDQSSLFSGTIGGTRIDTLGAINFNIAKTGTGTLTLSGANTYNGTTTVNGGTLLVNGSHTTVGTNPGGYTVNTGGTLGGTGSIARNITLAGGTLAPGASIESLDITGTVSLNSGAFHWEFSGGPPPLTNAPVGADVLNVSGALTIATATNITGANLGTDLLAGTKFVAISYNSTLTGVFGNALLDDDFVTIGGNQFIINYDDINFSGAINFNQALYGTAVTLTAIPEPSSILGLGFVGAIMIGAARIRKQYTLRRIRA